MSQFKIGQTVRRIENKFQRAPFKIESEYTLREVNKEADQFELVKDREELPDFDLPEVKDGLRIHRKPFEECESCSA